MKKNENFIIECPNFLNHLCCGFLPNVIVALDRGNEVAWNNPGSLKTQNLK
jgi:hypothetical protein